MSTIHTTLPPLLREWANAKLTRGPWKDALLSAVGFTVSRVEIYRVVCEHLDPIVDAVECVHEMTRGFGGETLKYCMMNISLGLSVSDVPMGSRVFSVV
ncbi:hypothetical protein EV363DRAFT_1166925 [Boletus edulis]|nr:hypothetical protein EV363DRAFT_1166925 [Boletus edulis]